MLFNKLKEASLCNVGDKSDLQPDFYRILQIKNFIRVKNTFLHKKFLIDLKDGKETYY